MPRALEFDTYRQFRHDLVRGGSAISEAIEELAEDLYHAQIDTEFDSMWDRADSDD